MLAVLLAGCAGGLIGPLPPVTKPDQASTVTVFRDFSFPGFFGPLVLQIDGCKLFRLWTNQEYSFALDPGEYLFYYTIGFNECQHLALIEPRRNYRFNLRPNCVRFNDRCGPATVGVSSPSRRGGTAGSSSPGGGGFRDTCY